jgi:hypothetical protein
MKTKISMDIPPDDLLKLKEIAKNEDRPLGWLLRKIIAEYLGTPKS